MTILDEIVSFKKTEVQKLKEAMPIRELESLPFYKRDTLSLSASLLDKTKTGIIAEFKRQSPSKGVINAEARVEDVTTAYAASGASGLSVLTDLRFFGGNSEDLIRARVNNQIPILRKDFMIDEYQLVEAKALGADVILLIAACLEKQQLYDLAKTARSLGLEVLMEVHDADELLLVNEFVNIVGVNNRNLKDFVVDLQQSVRLSDQIPTEFLKISESGIRTPEDIMLLKNHGFKGFLIGESFMKEENPGEAFAAFTQQLSALQ